MTDDSATGSNRLLYSIIGVLGGAVAVGGFFIFSGALPFHNAKLADVPAPAAQATAPSPIPAPAPPSAPPLAAANSDLNGLALSIDQAIAAGDFAYADSLLAEANRRYAGNGAWPPIQQRLARARADRETKLRQAEARRLIAEARSYAVVGDFADAEAILQEVDKHLPDFPETGQARGDIASMWTERGKLYRERYQYTAAIDQAFTADRLWEAERLLADYAQRFNRDDDYRARFNRLAEMRAAAAWQARLTQSRSSIANARQAMDRDDFVEAERQLLLADKAAPGFPEINQARADLSRRRIAAEQQQDGIRLILAEIDAAFQRRQYDDAERAIENGRRRYGSYSGWADLQRRNASARLGNEQQTNDLRFRNARALELVAMARRSMAQGDFATAERSLNEANALLPDMPEGAIARAEFERAKADRSRQDAESRAVAASVDAALARQQHADAERLIADGTRRFPSYAGWAELSRRLAESRRATPSQPSNAPMPAQAAPAQMPPAALSPPAPSTLGASLPAPVPNVATAPAANTQLPALVAAARDAIKRSDFAAAEKSVAEAERLDAKAAATVQIRAELKAALDKTKAPSSPSPATTPTANGPPASADNRVASQTPLTTPAPAVMPPATNTATGPGLAPNLSQLVEAVRDAIKRADFVAAEGSMGAAEKLDANAASVVEVRAELRAALLRQHVATARDAIKRSEFALAEKSVAEAEKLDAKDTFVVEVREELKAAEAKFKVKTQPANRK